MFVWVIVAYYSVYVWVVYSVCEVQTLRVVLTGYKFIGVS